jgi:alpha-mannosidase
MAHKDQKLEPPICDPLVFDTHTKTIHRRCITPPIGEETAGASEITQNITFSSLQPFIDFSTAVNWTQHDKLLKVLFPTNIRNQNARYGIQFGHINRPTHTNTKRDFAKFEVYGRYATLDESTRGVSVLSYIKTGYDVHGGDIRLSLLRVTRLPDRWLDYGQRKFIYRGVFHKGWGESHIPQLHDELLHSPILVDGSQTSQGTLPHESAFVTVDDKWVVLDTLKVAETEDGFIARFYEASGGGRRAKVTFELLKSSDWENPQIVDLLEEEYGGVIEKIPGEKLSFYVTVKTFEIVSLKIAKVK